MVEGSSGADPVDVTSAFAAARDLLQGAELEAERTRSEADHYARQREQEAELLVAKARRLLVAAEERAAIIIATSRSQAADPAAMDAAPIVIAAGLEHPATTAESGAEGEDRALPGQLDRMLAAAIARAVHDAFPLDEPVG